MDVPLKQPDKNVFAPFLPATGLFSLPQPFIQDGFVLLFFLHIV